MPEPFPGTNADWIAWFRRNGDHVRALPWELEPPLTQSEARAIASSIAEFQLGETGEGRHLVKHAKRYVARTGDDAYLTALAFFLGEEHRHARDLGRFMDHHSLPRARHRWPDTVFRLARHLGGLEGAIMVLVSAEIIAQVYYAALRDATQSPVLRALCEQILNDEAAHVAFQCGQIARLQHRRSRAYIIARRWQHIAIIAMAGVVVWVRHHRVFRAADYRRLYVQLLWQRAKAALELTAERLPPGEVHPPGLTETSKSVVKGHSH